MKRVVPGSITGFRGCLTGDLTGGGGVLIRGGGVLIRGGGVGFNNLSQSRTVAESMESLSESSPLGSRDGSELELDAWPEPVGEQNSGIFYLK